MNTATKSEITVAIDPGLNTSGVAIFKGGYLLDGWSVRTNCKNTDPLPNRIKAMGISIVHLVTTNTSTINNLLVEFPQVYDARKGLQKANSGNSVLPLAAIVGFVCAKVESYKIEYIKPREWKGQLPKNVCVNRVKNTLRIEDNRPERKLTHDGWDAVGIGLWYHGRINKA